MKLIILMGAMLGAMSLSRPAVAESFQCEVKINAASALVQRLNSVPNQKVVIGETSQIRAFLTENPNHVFSLEAFLPIPEARVYSEANMRMVGDIINLSYWDREILYELQCTAI